MTVSVTPWSIDGNTHPAAEARRAMAGSLGCDLTTSFAGGVGAVDPGHGVCFATDLKVAQNGTPNMSVLVAAGSAFIRGTQAASQGVYHAFNDASVNLSIAAANATNPRRDLIVLQIRDAAYSGATRDARLLVVTGTPAASPVDPSLSSTPNALVLARVTVAAAATSITNANITDLRTGAGEWFKGRGLVNSLKLQGSHGSIGGTITDISFGGTPLQVQFTAQANRKYMARALVRVDHTGGTAVVECNLRDSGGTTLAKTSFTHLTGETCTHTPETDPATVAAGSYTFKASLQIFGSGTSTAVGSSTQPMIIQVHDVGGVLA